MSDADPPTGVPADDRASASGAASADRAGVPRTAGVVALLVCLALVAIAEVLLARQVAGREQARFDRAVAGVEQRIVTRIESSTTLLRGGAGLFAATGDEVDVARFRRFATRIRLADSHPEIHGIGFSELVSAERAAALPAELARQGLPDVVLEPPGAGARHAIVFIEPLDRRNAEALGFDMHTEPVRREAMDRARDTGLPALSGKVKLVQEIDAGTQPGFLLYVPVYREGAVPETTEARRAALHGFVYAPIRAHDFVRRLFEGTDLLVDFAVHDGDVASEQTLLYGPVGPTGRIVAERKLDVAGRTWTLRYASNHRFDEAGSRGDLLALGIVGLAASVVVLWLVRRQTAARIAEERARRKEEKRRAQAEALAAELVALSNEFVEELERRRSGDPAPEGASGDEGPAA